MKFYYLIIFLAFNQTMIAQSISFDKLVTYFIYRDESKIKSDLRAQKFIIGKETKADSKFYDTQIACFKGSPESSTSLTGVVILKNNNAVVSISYVTLNNSDFNKKKSEIRNRGFELATEDTITQWYYSKGDTIITIAKKLIDIMGKDYIRYEIGVGVLPLSDNNHLIGEIRRKIFY
jgi:hypothetical protein